MKIIYLNFGISADHYKIIEEHILTKSQKIPQQIFDRAVYEGLKSNGVDILSLTLPPIPSFPNSKEILLDLNKNKLINKEENVYYIPVINIPVLKQLSVMVNTLKTMYSYRNNTDTKILINWPYLPFVSAAFFMKRFFKIDVVQIIPDFPSEYFSYKNKKNLIEKIYSFSSRATMKLISKSDGFVFLTKYMEEVIDKKNIKYCVVEGMINPDTEYSNTVPLKNNSDTKIKFMYAGSLNKKVGILNLVKAFVAASETEKNLELVIYGAGDAEEDVKNIALESKNIIFGGMLSRSEVLKKQSVVDFLVNPRPITEDYTKYSFPSKTLENMLSGTPLITTKLRGIPDEYNNYLIYFETDSIKGMANTLKEVVKINNDTRIAFGAESRNWIIVNKNPQKQTQKIIEMLKTL